MPLLQGRGEFQANGGFFSQAATTRMFLGLIVFFVSEKSNRCFHFDAVVLYLKSNSTTWC